MRPPAPRRGIPFPSILSKLLLLVLPALLLKLLAAGPPAVRVTLRPLTQAYLAAVSAAMMTKPATRCC